MNSDEMIKFHAFRPIYNILYEEVVIMKYFKLNKLICSLAWFC